VRGFFFLLLLSNVSLVAWQYFEERSKNEIVDVYRGIAMVNNGLTLISELPEQRRPKLREAEQPERDTSAVGAAPTEKSAEVEGEPTAAAESTTGIARDSRCYRIGDIVEKESVNKLMAWLRKNGASAIEQGQQQIKRSNYWVILPAYASREKANEAAEILLAKRIRDFFIVRSGDHENAISLGVFSTRERAERRYAQIVELKARLRKPKIESVERPAIRYQVTYKLKGEQPMERLVSYLKQAQLPAAEEISCK